MSTTSLSLEQRVDALESRNAVIELMANYCRGVDTYDEELWMSIWHHDAEYLIGSGFGDHYGHAQIKSILHALRAYFKEFHHYMTNIVVQVDGDRATAVANADVTATDKAGRAMMLAASYVDVCERRDGVWKFSKRDIDLHYAAPVDAPWTLERRLVLDAS